MKNNDFSSAFEHSAMYIILTQPGSHIPARGLDIRHAVQLMLSTYSRALEKTVKQISRLSVYDYSQLGLIDESQLPKHIAVPLGDRTVPVVFVSRYDLGAERMKGLLSYLSDELAAVTIVQDIAGFFQTKVTELVAYEERSAFIDLATGYPALTLELANALRIESTSHHLSPIEQVTENPSLPREKGEEREFPQNEGITLSQVLDLGELRDSDIGEDDDGL